MTHPSWDERFVDMLLAETLGQEAPPQLAARVLARASRPSYLRPVFWIGVAAALMLVVGGWWLLRYPGPQATGDYAVDGGMDLARGRRLRTASGTATLRLGDYADVLMRPGTVLTLSGTERAEQVDLEEGEVLCAVQRAGAGTSRTFAVATPLGTVSVVGTRFSVSLHPTAADGAPQFTVAVEEGTVAVKADGKTTRVTAPDGFAWPAAPSPRAPAAAPDPRPPLKRELLALRHQQTYLQRILAARRTALLRSPAADACLTRHGRALAAWDATVKAQPQIQALTAESRRLAAEQQRLLAKTTPAEERNQALAAMRATAARLHEIEASRQVLLNEDPQILVARRALQDAAATLLRTVDDCLAADPVAREATAALAVVERALDSVQEEIQCGATRDPHDQPGMAPQAFGRPEEPL